jgi:hypothetical protein
VRLNAFLLVVAMAGMVAGAALIGRWAVGCAVIADSVLVGVWALLHDVPDKAMRGDQLDLVRRRAS